MKAIAILLGLCPMAAWPGDAMAQALWRSDSCHVKFTSSTPLERIEAVNIAATATVNAEEGTVRFHVPISGFRFENSLMQKHFNSAMYMDSEKFPLSSFHGRLERPFEAGRDTSFSAKATGVMRIHGLDHADTYTGELEVREGRMYLTSEFQVRLDDHGIKIPGATFLNISQVIEVQVHFRLAPEK